MPSVAQVRSKAREIAREHHADPRALAVRARTLVVQGESQLGFEVFRASPKAVATLTPREIDAMLPQLCDWNSTDCFACFVSGIAWRVGVLEDAHIAGWARSESRWIRRAALASTIPLNCKARGATSPNGEATKTLAVCALLVDDRDDMVVKAMSWALREVVVMHRARAEAFLTKYESRLAARVLRETANKISTGLKNPANAGATRLKSTSARTASKKPRTMP